MSKFIKLARLQYLPILILLLISSSCERPVSSSRQVHITPYSCEGNCTPVQFEARISEGQDMYKNVYLSGTFNGWAHGDERLLMKKTSESTYRIQVDLPEGEAIKYRYTAGKSTYSGMAELGEIREVSTEERSIQQDSVAGWGTPLQTGSMTPEEMTRQSVQGYFLEVTLKDYELTSPITLHQVDSLMETAARTWKELGLLAYPGYDKLLSYAYLAVYYNRMRAGAHPDDEASECHVKSSYALPAFLGELDYIEETYEVPRYDLLQHWSYLRGIVRCGNLSDVRLTLLDSLHYGRLPALLDQLPLGADSVLLNVSVTGFRKSMEFENPDYMFLRTLRTGDLENARLQYTYTLFDTPGTYLSYSDREKRLRFMTKRLVAAYVSAGQTDEALELLDYVTEETNEFELPEDTLRTWYSQAASEQGVARLQQLLAFSGRSQFKGEGEPIDFTGSYLNLTDSTQFDMASLKGKRVVIDFWATFCVPCIAEIPDLMDFADRIEDRDDLVFISISQDEVIQFTLQEQLETYLETYNIDYPVLMDNPDNPISRHFNVTAFPSKYLVDADGRLVSQISSVWQVLSE